VERTDIDSDDYFPSAKHAARTPTNLHLASPPPDKTSNGRAASAQLTTAGAVAERGLKAEGEDGPTGSTEFGAAAPEQIPPIAGPAGTDVDRVSAIWRARYAIVASTLAVGIAVYLLASASAAVYSSSSSVSITAASTPGGSAQDVALASNSLAAQDALVVTSDSVLAAAARRLGISPSTLSSHLSSGTLKSQNFVQITAQGPTRDDALRWVRATTTAFTTYLAERARRTSSSLQDSIAAQTESLNQQIALLQLVVNAAQNEYAPPGSAALVNLQSYENQLNQLVATRATLTANTALAIASQQPVITVIVSGTAPSKVSPRPTLYATVAALLTLLVACQVAIFIARRKTSRVRPQ
jgi:DNA-binding transcriptional regulator YdaS (Cro superfamily)